LEEGPVATPFEHRPISVELSLAQRYYQQSYDVGTVAGTATYTGAYQYRTGTTSNEYQTIDFIVPMHHAPALVYYGTTANTNTSGDWRGSGDVAYVVNTSHKSTQRFSVNIPDAGEGVYISGHWTADAEL
jgi:hypothetical protein